MDDYSNQPYFATFTRWLKYLAFFIATLLPGIYVAVGTFNPEVFPEELMNKIATAIATTPFPLMLEALVIHFIYEIMREAGLRLPKPPGHAVSIVGALVIGDTAISSGLIGATTLMVVALTAISSYVIPSLYEPIAILRLLFIIVGLSLIHIYGRIARKHGLVTDFGKFADPVADKILTMSAFVCFVALGWADAALVIIILAREFIVTSIRLVAAGGGKVIAANLWGKAKTVSQIFAILLVLALQAVNSATGYVYLELFW